MQAQLHFVSFCLFEMKRRTKSYNLVNLVGDGGDSSLNSLNYACDRK